MIMIMLRETINTTCNKKCSVSESKTAFLFLNDFFMVLLSVADCVPAVWSYFGISSPLIAVCIHVRA